MFLYELTKPQEIAHVRDLKMTDKTRADSSNPGDSWAKITEYFKARGFSPIGAGAKATVYDHPRYPFVIKFFYKDSAYRTWLNFCKQNQQNPYVPKIKGAPTKIKGTDFYFVRLEKLHQLYDISIPHNKMRMFIDIIDVFWDTPSMGIAALNREKERMENEKIPVLIDYPDSLLEVFSFLNKYKSYLDLHIGNLMTRSNGEFVIVDPLYSEKDAWFFE